MVFGLQQTAISVIAASVQEFDSFPFLSIVAFSFIFVMSSLVLMVWLGVVSWMISRFKIRNNARKKKWLQNLLY